VYRVKGEALIPPGGSRTCRFSLRVAPAGASLGDIARRPVREIRRGVSDEAEVARSPADRFDLPGQPATGWPTNPRGWLNEKTLDVTTDAGRAVFKKKLMEFADRSVKVLKDVGAQGAIVWDIEGDEMPHAITYIGDPRVLPEMAPEMNAVADEFFQRFRDAGLRTGICIRPSRVVPDPGGKHRYTHRNMGLDHVQEMSEKIALAQKRWGCTLFYMDTKFHLGVELRPEAGQLDVAGRDHPRAAGEASGCADRAGVPEPGLLGVRQRV